jgi:hypothetical protein
MLIAAAIVLCTAVPAFASGSAVDQFSAVKYIRNLSDLASQYRDHGLSLQLDGHNYEWLIFSDSLIRRNMEAELIVLGRSREHIIDPLAWQLHVDMLNSTIEQINTITDELDTYNFREDEQEIVEKIGRTASDGSSILGDIEDELAKGEERNYANLASYGEKLWMIGNDLICQVKDLEFENWTALYSDDLCAGDGCQNQFNVMMACWDCGSNCGSPSVSTACVKGKECADRKCPKPTCKACKSGTKCSSCSKCGRT